MLSESFYVANREYLPSSREMCLYIDVSKDTSDQDHSATLVTQANTGR